MAKKITVKIQRPLFDSEGEMNKLLIYDKRRTFQGEIFMDRDTIESLFPGGGYKGFARGFLKGTQFHIEHLIDPEDWPSW